MNKKRGVRSGFTLVELVVVVMILGILAAIAVPKLLSTARTATDGGVKQTLGVVRNVIELYAADNGGSLPGSDGTEATFKTDVQPYLRTGAPFPSCPVGAKNGSIRVETSGAALTADASPTKGWAFDNVSGQFIINSGALSTDGVTAYKDF